MLGVLIPVCVHVGLILVPGRVGVRICMSASGDPEFHLFLQRLTNKAQSLGGSSHWCSENQRFLAQRGRLISPCCSLNFVSYFRRPLVVVGSWVSLRRPRLPFCPPVCTPQAEAAEICLTEADRFTSLQRLQTLQYHRKP